jgi:KaiC/GvpD/RAD55 family RecA-like ATPase
MVSATDNQKNGIIDFDAAIKGVLTSIDREREQEIISRRFGLYDRKETLEQIGELLGITRERVRQLEKVVLAKLKNAASNRELKDVTQAESKLLNLVTNNNDCMRISDLAAVITKKGDRVDQARIFFLATLAPKISVVDESDHFYKSIGTKSVHDSKKMKDLSNKLLDTIKKIGTPTTIAEIAQAAGFNNSKKAAALAKISKHITELNGQWGLTKWPMVNPKNIRDKIYVILSQKGEHMHFNEIAGAIRESEFKRKDVTTQAIHNELIKDDRFVLIGRGIYALDEWGYRKGTVADTISEVLKDAGKPLHRDEIVKRVLKSRHVKETTILLNLQGKVQFKRVAKATYALAESA